MEKSIDLRNDPINKLFYHYLFSAVTGMLMKSIHVVLDGIFVSNGVGPGALAAVNIIMPLFSMFMAIAMMIGAGGSTLASMKFGEEKDDVAQNIFTQSIIMMFVIGIIAIAAFLVNPEAICRFLGANDAIIDYTIEYGRYIAYFGPFFTLGICLSVFVRNDANPKTSMYSMVTSAVVNIILNYIFIMIMKMGLKGAAIATGISQIVSCIILSTHFIKRKGKLKFIGSNFKIQKNELLRTFQIGFPSFLGEISFGIVSLVFNRVLMSISGELAVSAFSIMMYVTALMYMVFFGIGQAMQPIISFSYGANKYDRVYGCFHLAVKTGFLLGIFFTVSGLIFVEEIVMLFNRENAELIEMAITANRLLFYVFPFAAYNICVSTFFQATGNAKVSTAISILRGFILNICLIFVLSNFFGLYGVWLVYPVAEVVSMLISIYLMKASQDIISKAF